jgi:succinate dehydrogenase / fumarate reductase, cytochrome b subunit
MASSKAENPLSPHLQIYSPLINMVMSIFHRLTGAALYAGSLLLAWWLIALASGPEAYDAFHDFMGGFVGRLVLFGFTWALIHHMLGGLRHFVWDTGHGLDKATVDRMSWATIVGSVVLTVALWAVGYGLR